MAKAIIQNRNLTFAISGLGERGKGIGSIAAQTHDGDTLTVRLMGNFGVRFLGVDAPEVSAQLPDETAFKGLNHVDWELFLSNPFDTQFKAFGNSLGAELKEYLLSKQSNSAAENHYHHAKEAEKALENELQKDLITLNKTTETFELFVAFAHDIMDRYGRLLGFINRYQPDSESEEDRPLSYNERLLQQGLVCPYFIWPNINPFRKYSSLLDAVFPPDKLQNMAQKDSSLRSARNWVKTAREEKLGIFDAKNSLIFEPFELRYLSRRMPPDRWLIDLSSQSDELLQPQDYWKVENLEDRLYIPAEFVALFIEKGWKK